MEPLPAFGGQLPESDSMVQMHALGCHPHGIYHMAPRVELFWHFSCQLHHHDARGPLASQPTIHPHRLSLTAFRSRLFPHGHSLTASPLQPLPHDLLLAKGLESLLFVSVLAPLQPFAHGLSLAASPSQSVVGKGARVCCS